MRLSPWQIFGPLAVAVVVLAAMFLHQAAPASCGQAKTSKDHYLDEQAAGLYADILDDEPDSGCATRGMKDVAERMCGRADKLAAKGANEQATKLYSSILELEPIGHAAFKCVKDGLAKPDPNGKGGGKRKCRCPMVCPASCPARSCPEPQDEKIDRPFVLRFGIALLVIRKLEINKPEPPNKPRKVHPKSCAWPG